MTRIVRFAAIGVSVSLALAAGELAIRYLDGFALSSVRLRPVRPEEARPAPVPAPVERIDRREAAAMPLAPGIDAAWYDSDPPENPRRPDDPMVLERLRQYPNDPIGALFAWNPMYLREQLCAGNTAGSLGILNEFLVFDPVEPTPYPIFRHLPNANPPGWFTSNAFGWRGPALMLKKPAGTIRIAFVGASTTVSGHGLPYSHPELVGHWLNVWARSERLPVRFEVINAGRTGIDSSSIAAIVRQEVVAVDPDLVIYYEGANQFAPGKLMRMPPKLARKPTATFRRRTPLEDYLASVRRALTALDMTTAADGSEPWKPDYPVVWPDDVDEQVPDVTHKPLPMDLDAVVANLDQMRASLSAIGAELGMSSFLWMVDPDMKLDLSKNLTLYRYLNDSYWPATYAHMRRTADFQNRLFAAYAARYGLPFFDIAGAFPMDPSLFGDAIHLHPDGLRLQAWIYLQQLAPVIRARLDAGVWPRQASRAPERDPSAYTPRLATRREIVASCPR